MKLLSFALSFCFISSLFADMVTESARKIPIYTNVDVLVVGGSVGAVSAATAARQAGASVYLVAPRPYLGEDLAGTLRLRLSPEEKPATPLARRLFFRRTTTLPFDYKTTLLSCAPHRDEFGCKLSDGSEADIISDTVQFSNDVRIVATLAEPALLESVEVVSFVRKGDFEAASAHLILSEDGQKWSRILPFMPVRENMDMVRFSAKIGFPARFARIAVLKKPEAKRLLLSEVIFRVPDTGEHLVTPTPLHVKRTLDAELLTNHVAFLTGAFATETLRDSSGAISGVMIADRSGRQAILAKTVIDATERATVARLAGAAFTSYPAGVQTFERMVIAGEPPKADGMTVERLSGRHPASLARGNNRNKNGSVVTGSVFRCSLSLPMQDGSFRSFAAAEQLARDKTFVKSQLDASDSLFQVPPDHMIGSLPHLIVLGGCADIPREEARRRAAVQNAIQTGRETGRAAAKDAFFRKPFGTLSVCNAATQGTVRPGGVRELLNGLRPYQNGLPAVASPERKLPVLGAYDTVVVGGGTAGAPAAIASAREGAKTLVIEYLYGLGGIGTEGMIGLYCYGNICGFTARHDSDCAKLGASVHVIGKAETWRRECQKAGAEIWFGAMGCGTLVDNGKVTGVVVATPDGRGVVLAKNVIDATGNADLAAASGAPCVFQNAGEIAVQGAGLSPQRLGASYINSDFGYVNDGDAEDLWLFGVRGRAGAPDAWDISQVAGSRERRRVVGAYTVSTLDVVNGRTFPDTVLQARANFDSHGYSVDDICYVSEPDGKRVYSVNVPYRSLLPKTLDGLAVVGLGASCHRDVMPMVRMQPDLQNMGYAAGVAAAMAAKADVSLRAIDVKDLQRKLIREGNIEKGVLNWKDNAAISSEGLAMAVRNVAQNYHNIGLVLAHTNEALPLLRQAYEKADTATAKEIYAHVLGILGDPAGAATLAKIVMSGKPMVELKDEIAFGRRMDEMGSRIIALGRTRDPAAVKPLLAVAAKLNDHSPFQRFRAVSLALEALASPAAAQTLAEVLRKPGISGYARIGAAAITPAGGYGGNGEMQKCLRELGLARALYRSGDENGLAKKILTDYSQDARGIYALHATAVLNGK